MKRLMTAFIAFFICAIGFSWTCPDTFPTPTRAVFWSVYLNEYLDPINVPDTVFKDNVNVVLISFVHVYDKSANALNFCGTNKKSYKEKDPGALKKPTGSHCALAYEQARDGGISKLKAGDTDYDRIKAVVDYAHKNGAIALLSLGYSDDWTRVKNECEKYPESQWQFAQSVMDFVKIVGADGFEIDCEGGMGDTKYIDEVCTQLRKLFDKEQRHYFLALDSATYSGGIESWGIKTFDNIEMVFDQSYYSDQWDVNNKFCPGRVCVGASYDTSLWPDGMLTSYESYKDKGCRGGFIWTILKDKEKENFKGVTNYLGKIK